MRNLGTQLSNVNSDPTKWRDCIGEFCTSATSNVSLTAVAASVASVTTVGAAAVGVAGSIAPTAILSGAVAGVSALLSSYAVMFLATAAESTAVRPRPLARKLGLVFPSLVALATGGFITHNFFAEETQPTAAPDVIFNVTAQDCKSEHVKAAISKIKADGFSVACAKPAP